MVRLPDWTQVEGPKKPETFRQIHSYDIGDATQGIREWGNSFKAIEEGFSKLGAGLNTAYEGFKGQQAKETGYQSAAANSAFLVESTKLDAERERVTDPAKLPEYGQKYNTALETASQGIADPEARERFRISHAPTVAGHNAQVDRQKYGIEKNDYFLKTERTLEELHQTGVMVADEAGRTKFIEAGNTQIQRGIDAGYYSPEQGLAKRKEWANKYTIGGIEALPDEEQLRIVGPEYPNQPGAGGQPIAPATGPMPAGRDIAGAHGDSLWSFTAPNGQKLTTIKEAAWRFNGLLTDLAARGYQVKDVGGYNDRLKRGGTTLSEHAHGNAIDINPLDNPMGPTLKTNLPPDISQMAAKWGLTWGGDWKGRKDAMHFEYKPPKGGSQTASAGGQSQQGGAAAGAQASPQGTPTVGAGPQQATPSSAPPPAQGPTVPTQEASVARKIYDVAVQRGVSPNLVLGIAFGEGLNPNTLNSPDYGNPDGEGRSFGPFQLHTGPKGGMADEFRKKYGEMPSAKNIDAQIEFAVETIKAKGTGAWKAVGDRGGEAAITAEGAKHAARLGLGGAGGGSGGAVSPADMPGADPAGTSLRDPRLKYITEEQRRGISRNASARIKRRGQDSDFNVQQEKQTLTVLKESDKQSIMETGQPVGTISPDRVAAVHGPEAGARFQDERAAQSEYYVQTRGQEGKTEAEIETSVESLKPPAGDPVYEEKNKLYTAARKKADDILQLRRDDPAAAADKMPALKEVRKNADPSNPASMIPLANNRMAMQAHLGIPEGQRSPITDAEAAALWKPVKDAGVDDKPAAMKEFLETLRSAYGDQYARQAYNHILKQETVSSELRTQAWPLMSKIARGEPLTRQDGRAVDKAKVRDAASKAIEIIPPSRRPIRTKHEDELLANPTEQEQKLFDGAYGDGEAARILRR